MIQVSSFRIYDLDSVFQILLFRFVIRIRSVRIFDSDYLITGVCAAAGLYGVYSHDRGWLMLSVIFQSSLVTTCGIYIGTLLRQRTLGASKADGQEWFSNLLVFEMIVESQVHELFVKEALCKITLPFFTLILVPPH